MQLHWYCVNDHSHFEIAIAFDASNRLHCCMRLFKQHCLSCICTKWVSHQYEHRSRKQTVWTSLGRSVTFPAPAKVTIKTYHCANGDGPFDAQNGHNIKLWWWRCGRGMVTIRVTRHLFIKRHKPHVFESNLQVKKAPKEHATETSSALRNSHVHRRSHCMAHIFRNVWKRSKLCMLLTIDLCGSASSKLFPPANNVSPSLM